MIGKERSQHSLLSHLRVLFRLWCALCEPAFFPLNLSMIRCHEIFASREEAAS